MNFRPTKATSSANLLVRPRGFEPLTCGLEDRCSIQLSYGRVDGECIRSWQHAKNEARQTC
jgi:hypothetical protein